MNCVHFFTFYENARSGNGRTIVTRLQKRRVKQQNRFQGSHVLCLETKWSLVRYEFEGQGCNPNVFAHSQLDTNGIWAALE